MSLFLALMMIQAEQPSAEAALETVRPCLIENLGKAGDKWSALSNPENDWQHIKAIAAACGPEIRAASILYRAEHNKSAPEISSQEAQAILTEQAEIFVYTLINQLNDEYNRLASANMPDKYQGIWAKSYSDCKDQEDSQRMYVRGDDLLIYNYDDDRQWKKLATLINVATGKNDVRFTMSWAPDIDETVSPHVQGRFVVSYDGDKLFAESLNEDGKIDFLVRCRSLEPQQ